MPVKQPGRIGNVGKKELSPPMPVSNLYYLTLFFGIMLQLVWSLPKTMRAEVITEQEVPGRNPLWRNRCGNETSQFRFCCTVFMCAWKMEKRPSQILGKTSDTERERERCFHQNSEIWTGCSEMCSDTCSDMYCKLSQLAGTHALVLIFVLTSRLAQTF